MCKYNQNSEDDFNLEDFLSQLQSFFPFVSEKDKLKLDSSFNKIIEIIKEKHLMTMMKVSLSMEF